MLSSSAVDRVLGIQTGNHGETHRPWTLNAPKGQRSQSITRMRGKARHARTEVRRRACSCGVSGYRESDVGTSRSLPTGEITELLESGVDSREIVRRMVATGDWSEAGAVGFVSFLTHGLDAPASPVRVEHPDRRGDTA